MNFATTQLRIKILYGYTRNKNLKENKNEKKLLQEKGKIK